MNIIFKIVGIAMVSIVLCLFVEKQNKDLAILLSIAAICGIFLYAGNVLSSVMNFVDELHAIGDLNKEFLSILMKATGIGLVTEISVLICTDSGYAALGKTIQLAGVLAIICTSLPLFSALLELLNNILGEV